MDSKCCGICIYGKNEHKYPNEDMNECMIHGYEPHTFTHSCNSFMRDYKKNIVVKSIHDVKKG